MFLANLTLAAEGKFTHKGEEANIPDLQPNESLTCIELTTIELEINEKEIGQ
jgi:hypothetical protein